jgi:hypothetical protein
MYDADEELEVTRRHGHAPARLDANSTKDSRIATNPTGAKFKNTDITLSARVRVERAPVATKTVRLTARQAATTENKFYALALTVNLADAISKVSIMKKVDDGAGNYTICSLAEAALATPVDMNQWRTISLTLRNHLGQIGGVLRRHPAGAIHR